MELSPPGGTAPLSPGDEVEYDGDFLSAGDFATCNKPGRVPDAGPLLRGLLVQEILASTPQLGARRLRRGFSQGKWNGTPWQLRGIGGSPQIT